VQSATGAMLNSLRCGNKLTKVSWHLKDKVKIIK